mmetsp:Transcript_77922/g.155972  ORF Transcript_77922/g.155972 Transcript_77922/m.155972 type:complete len:137 (-) Transcript_77922:524-934(-)
MRPLRAMPALGRSSVAIVGHDTKLGEMGFFSFLARHRRAPSVQMHVSLKETTAAAVALVSAVWRRTWWGKGKVERDRTPSAHKRSSPWSSPRSPPPPPQPRSQRLLVLKGYLEWLLVIPGPSQIFRRSINNTGRAC